MGFVVLSGDSLSGELQVHEHEQADCRWHTCVVVGKGERGGGRTRYREARTVGEGSLQALEVYCLVFRLTGSAEGVDWM